MVLPVLTGIERQLLSFLVLESEILISLALEVSALGSTIFAAIVIAGLWYMGDRETAEELFFSLVTVNIIVRGVKSLVSRPRPQGAVTGSFTYSFPSGHAATAFLMASVLSARYPGLRRFLYGLAALIALTRVLLGLHYLTDVLAGSVIGLGIGYLVNNREEMRRLTGKLSF
ncbi:MAG: phosphatase PAP2 family protein [Candidatus Nanosalina sp.]